MRVRLSQNGFGHVQSFIVLIVILIVGVAGWLVYNGQQDGSNKSNSSINSFEECAAAGNPIMESYPEQCSANGKTFTRDISETE